MTTKVDDLINRLEAVREEKGLPRAKFGPNELGVSKWTYRKWVYREYEPNAENTINIIEYLEKNEN